MDPAVNHYICAQMAFQEQKYEEGEKILTDMINKIQNINESNKKYLIRCYELLCKVHFQRHQYQNALDDINQLVNLGKDIYTDDEIISIKWESLFELNYAVMLNDIGKLKSGSNLFESFIKRIHSTKPKDLLARVLLHDRNRTTTN